MTHNKNTAARTARLSVMLALAMILSYVEHIVGFDVGVPGVKVGFANIVGLFALYRYGFSEGFAVNICRILLSALLFGNVLSLSYGLVGGLVSFIAMWVLKKQGFFGTVGVSVVGAAFHNLAQLSVAAFWMGSVYVFSYAPVLLIAGTVFGTITGVLCVLILQKIPKKL